MTRDYNAPRNAQQRRPHHVRDHRVARPHHRSVRTHRSAYRAVPRYSAYRSWYSHWYIHPYYRHWHASTCVVGFTFNVFPWRPVWVPPSRVGWVWVAGAWYGGVWWPGYWEPTATTTVVVYDTQYVYVPGYWQGEIYVDGYYRSAERTDGGWEWVEGYYLEDGTYLAGHWRPTTDAPEGYTWEPGFFDGEAWVGGFWRPEFRRGFVWVSSWFDSDGIFHAGYWEPLRDEAGFVWVPGWFDGTQWVEGEWVSEADYQAADPSSWEPEPGWNEGWDEEASPWEAASPDEVPLALPVTPEIAEETL